MNAQAPLPTRNDSPTRQDRRPSSAAYGFMVAVAAVGALALVAFVGMPHKPAPTSAAAPSALSLEQTADSPQAIESSAVTRPVYPYSIVPGGVLTPAELEHAIAADPVVAAHYAGLNVAALRVVHLREPREAHVSYRIGNQVYWTTKKLRLKIGEAVLTDGTTMVRARCGNMVSDKVLGQTSQAEPAPELFDSTSAPTMQAAASSNGGSSFGGPVGAPSGVSASANEDAGLRSGSQFQGTLLRPSLGSGPRTTSESGNVTAGSDPGPRGQSTPQFDPGPTPNPGPTPGPSDDPKAGPNPDPSPNPKADPDPGPKGGPKSNPDPGPDPRNDPNPTPGPFPDDPDSGPVPVPEPTTLVLVGIGAGGALIRHLHKRRSKRSR